MNGINGTTPPRGVLTRLVRDRRGNTMALVAAGMIPLIGLIGGGVDMSRIYLVKSRLQQACDAGALAGRKVMGVNTWSTTGTGNSNDAALAMFDANFVANDYGTGTRTRSFSGSGTTVNGTATVAVPMAVMKAFGVTSKSVTVTCTADMMLPNTDVMFVLDVTGSMNCVAGDAVCTNNGNVAAPGSKIIGLKRAVKCFYEALVKVNTSEICGSDPTATTYTQTAQLRIGFVPYSVNVNVGKLLPHSYIADTWAYQTRVPNITSPGTTTTNDWEIYSPRRGSSISQTDCQKYIRNESPFGTGVTTITSGGPSPTPLVTTTYVEQGGDSAATPDTEWGWPGARDDSGGDRSCRRWRTVETTTYVDTFANWTYRQATLNVSGLKNGDGVTWNSSVSLPLGTTGTNDTSVTWDGCIEERQTFQNTDGTTSDDWATIPATAFDMDIDMLPSATAGTQWGPMLPGAIFYRSSNSGGSMTTADVISASTFSRPLDTWSYYCTTKAKKLRSWISPTVADPEGDTFETYVNSLTAIGNTYHDIGLIWGARLISPTGMFATENTNLSYIRRHIIFMTDGDVRTFHDDYSAYGIHWWDRRQTNWEPDNRWDAFVYDDSNQMNQLINARLAAMCTAIKNKNITLWVVSFGGNVNATTETNLSNCASSGKFFSADNNAELLTQFRQIASQVAELRLIQ